MDFKEFIQQALYLVATGILPVLTVYVVTLLKTEIEKKTTQLNNEQTQKYINSAVETIGMIVIEINQTFVDELKRSGKFTEEAAIKAKNLAIEKCKQLISENAKKAIEVMYNDYEEFLNSKIEELVNTNKNN